MPGCEVRTEGAGWSLRGVHYSRCWCHKATGSCCFLFTSILPALAMLMQVKTFAGARDGGINHQACSFCPLLPSHPRLALGSGDTNSGARDA